MRSSLYRLTPCYTPFILFHLEQLTVQLPLHNPWRVPLVLTDVHLVWQAWFSNPNASSSDIDTADADVDQAKSMVVISNEECNPERLRTARKYVVTESVNEFYMLPGDRKTVGSYA